MATPIYRNIIKYFGNKADDYLANVKLNRIPDEYLRSVDESLGANPKQIIGNEGAFLDASEEGVRNVLRMQFTNARKAELTTSLNSHLKDLKPGQDYMNNVSGFFDLKIKNATFGYEERQNLFVSQLENGIQKEGGTEAYNLYNVLFNYPKTGFDKFGYSQKDVFLALANENFAKSPQLKAIAKVYKKTNKEFSDGLKSMIFSGYIDDHVTSFAPNAQVAQSLGEDAMTEALMKYTVGFGSTEQARKMVNKYMKSLIKAQNPASRFKFPQQQLKFKEGIEGVTDQFELYKFLNGVTEEDSILRRLFANRERQMQRAYFFREFGEDPKAMISEMFSKLKKGQNLTDVELLAEREGKVLRTLELGLGQGYNEPGTMRYVAEGINKFTSAVFGSGGSGVRNHFLDYTLHPLSFMEGLFTKETTAEFFMSRMYKPISFLASNLKQFNNPDGLRSQLNSFLNTFSFASTNNTLLKDYGIRMEHFLGTTLKSGKNLSKGRQAAEVFNESMGRLNAFIQNVTGNTIHYDASSALNVWNTAFGFSELVLKNNTYKEFLRAAGPKGEKYLKLVFDLGENEFAAIKEAYSTLAFDVPVNDLKKKLGFQGGKVLLPRNFRDIPLNIVNKYRKKGETVSGFRSRLETSYHSFLAHQRNAIQTNLSRSNKIIDQGIARGTFIDLLLRNFAKFFDITHAQHYDGLRTMMSVGLYGSPFDTGFNASMMNRKGAGYWARAIGYYGSGGLMVTWLKDILNGFQPREIDGEEAMMILAGSGAFGIPGSIMGGFGYGNVGPSYFGSSTIGTVVDKTGKAVADWKNPYRSAKAVQDLTGVGKLWWNKGAVDYVLRSAFLDKGERKNLDKWYKENFGSEYLLQ